MSMPAQTVEAQDPLEPVPVLVGRPGDRALTDDLTRFVLGRPPKAWLLLVLLGLGGVGLSGLAVFVSVSAKLPLGALRLAPNLDFFPFHLCSSPSIIQWLPFLAAMGPWISSLGNENLPCVETCSSLNASASLRRIRSITAL